MEIIIKSQEIEQGVRFRYMDTDSGSYYFVDKLFNNYFYLLSKDYYEHENDFKRSHKKDIKEIISVGQFLKIVLNNNYARIRIRDFWEARVEQTYEADIRANKRMLIDHDFPLHNDLIPYTFFDIETDDRRPMQKDDRGNVIPRIEDRILSFSAVDYKGESVFYILEEDTNVAEKKLIQQILEYFQHYGIVSGWYSDKFDMPYIRTRAELYQLDATILDFLNHIDYMDIFKKYDKKSRRSYSLNNISNEVLHESKLEQGKGNGKIYHTWQTDKEHLKAYNLEDSNLIYKINLKMSFIEVSMNRANLAHCHVQSTMNNSDSGDYLLMRAFMRHGVIMPSQPTKEQIAQRSGFGSIGGGYTTCFLPGFHKNVKVWDFKSLYPSIIQTWNLSPETYVKRIEEENEVEKIDRNEYIITPPDFENYYRPSRLYLKTEGVVPQVVRMLVEERDKTKYAMGKYQHELNKDGSINPDYNPDLYKKEYLAQYALKTDSNSIYGVLSFPNSRYYNWELGDSVTTCARATIKHCYDKLIEWGCTVLGGDTDSTFVITGNMSWENIDDRFKKLLDEWAIKWGVVNNKLVFEFEKEFDTMLFCKKKNYAYKMFNEIHITGMEAIKSDANPLAAKLQREFIEDVLYEKYDEKKWQGLIEEIYYKVFNQNLQPDELTLVKALTKMPKDYIGYVIDSKTGQPKVKANGELQMKAIPAHVFLAERLMEQGKEIYPGSKIKFIVVKDKPILSISPEEFEKGGGFFPYKDKKKGHIMYQWEGTYEAKYYWLRIIKPLIKVLFYYYGELPKQGFNWNLTASELKKMVTISDDDEESD